MRHFSKLYISANTGKSHGLRTSKFAPTPRISNSRAKCLPTRPMPFERLITNTVVANGFRGAIFQSLLCRGDFLRSRGLAIHICIASLVVASEKLRSVGAAEVAIDAGIVHIKSAGDI